MEDKTLSSIMSELSRNIVPFVTDNHLISALSRQNNITPDDLEYGTDVFINIPEHLLRQWRNLLTLIVQQFLAHFEQRPEGNARPILFLLDEFPRLGKISVLLDGLATLRSKKISICLIIQSLAQLDAIYGQNERKIIADTCGFKAVLGANDADTQEYFSRLAGTFDKTMISRSSSGNLMAMGKGSSISTQEQEKRIIPPHEFGMLADLVLFTPFPMPLEKPQSINQQTDNEFWLELFGGEKPANTINAPFCRVAKLPYYIEEL
jgi:type IV secretion system protein VirD4